MIDLNYLSKILSNKRSGHKSPRFVGYSKRRSTCEHCGKEDLSKSFVYEMPDGTTKCVGSKCAAKFKNSYDDSNYESVYDDLVAENPDLRAEIEILKSRDPSGNMKYLRWQVKILKSGQAQATEISEVTDLYHRFISLRPTRDPSGNPLPLPEGIESRDINFYGPDKFTLLRDNLFYIRDLTSGLSEIKKKFKTKAPSSEDAPIIYGEGDDKRFSVVYIKTKKASAFYGKGTKWCITMGFQAFWEDYEFQNNVFFFIVDKKVVDDIESKKISEKEAPDLYKIAVQVKRDSSDNVRDSRDIIFWNTLDKTVNYFDVKDYIGEKEFENVINAIIPYALKHKKSLIAKLGSREVNYEELKSIFDEVKDYKSENAKLSIFSKLINDSNVNESMISYIMNFAIEFYISDCKKYNDLLKFEGKEDSKEFKLWKINNRVPVIATVDSVKQALRDETYQIKYLINSCLEKSKTFTPRAIKDEDLIKYLFMLADQSVQFYDIPFNSIIKNIEYQSTISNDAFFKKVSKIKYGLNKDSVFNAIANNGDKKAIELLLSKKYLTLDGRVFAYNNPNADEELIKKGIKTERDDYVFSELIKKLESKDIIKIMESLRKNKEKNKYKYQSALCAISSKKDIDVACYISNLDEDSKKKIAQNCYDINHEVVRILSNSKNEEILKPLAERYGGSYQDSLLLTNNKDVKKILANRLFSTQYTTEPKITTTYSFADEFFSNMKKMYDRLGSDSDIEVKKEYINSIKNSIENMNLKRYEEKRKYFKAMIDSLEDMKRQWWSLPSEDIEEVRNIVKKINSFEDQLKEIEEKEKLERVSRLSGGSESSVSREKEESELKKMVSDVIRRNVGES